MEIFPRSFIVGKAILFPCTRVVVGEPSLLWQTLPQAHESAFSALSGCPVTQKTPVPAIGPNLINPLLQYGDRGQGWSHLSHDLNRSGRSYSLAQKISLFATVPRVKSNFTKMTPQLQPLWVCGCVCLLRSFCFYFRCTMLPLLRFYHFQEQPAPFCCRTFACSHPAGEGVISGRSRDGAL